MADFDDELESELRSFMPEGIAPGRWRKISAQPVNQKSRQVKTWQPLLGVAATAAAVAFVLSLGVTKPSLPQNVTFDQPVSQQQYPSPDSRLPSVQVYLRAYAKDPGELDRILDQHSRELFSPSSPTTIRFQL
jgi:hypothetical protein